MRQVFLLIPALIHVYIFVLESLLWGKPRTNKAFGVNEEEAKTTKLMAFNQGIYNLLLALGIVTGAILMFFPETAIAGKVLAIYGLGSIFVAGFALISSAPKLWRSALIQIVPATAGLVAAIV